jgi:oligopeptide/dipeptide ABC transporter ATP-binding protein
VALADGALRFGGDGQMLAYRPEDVRGHGIAMVFQEPMTALNPSKRVGDLVAEGPRLHQGLSRAAARRHAIELLAEVGVPDPERRARAWPWQLSGGLRQRVMIAMALSCEPSVLLCDEPTTALDVSVQDQILRLLDRLRRDRGLALVFVTHDLPVIGQIAQRVAVMYAGRIVESGTTAQVLGRPRHPYTAALLRSAPVVDRPTSRLATIAGAPPEPGRAPEGCRFRPRCAHAAAGCGNEQVLVDLEDDGHLAACERAAELRDSIGLDRVSVHP